MSRKKTIVAIILTLLCIGVLSVHLFSRPPLFHMPFRDAHPEDTFFSAVILWWPKSGVVDFKGNYASFDIERNITVVVVTGKLGRHADDVASGASGIGSRQGSVSTQVNGKWVDIYFAEPSDATPSRAVLFKGTRYEYEVDSRPNRLVLSGIDMSVELRIPVGQTGRWEKTVRGGDTKSTIDILVDTYIGSNPDRFQYVVRESVGVIKKGSE